MPFRPAARCSCAFLSVNAMTQGRWRGQQFRVKISIRAGEVVDAPALKLASMTICERCGTENLDGSRYCDECGAALWLAGGVPKAASSGPQSNGSEGRRLRAPSAALMKAAAGQEPSVMSEKQTSAPLVAGGNNAHATLVIERGSSAGKQFPLSLNAANIGRWDADGGIFPDVDLDADDPEAKVSRRHARITLRDGEYLIEDLGSTNGTFVNRGHRLTPGDRQPIKDGDEIIVGKTFLRFRVSK